MGLPLVVGATWSHAAPSGLPCRERGRHNSEEEISKAYVSARSVPKVGLVLSIVRRFRIAEGRVVRDVYGRTLVTQNRKPVLPKRRATHIGYQTYYVRKQDSRTFPVIPADGRRTTFGPLDPAALDPVLS